MSAFGVTIGIVVTAGTVWMYLQTGNPFWLMGTILGMVATVFAGGPDDAH